ncbi:MAG: serine protease [Planctomycetes bacterium]|nr:serine protease [Planctomycetota bacterium]
MKDLNHKWFGLTGCIIFLIVAATGSPALAEVTNGNTYDKSVIMVRCVQQQFDYSTPWKQKAMGSGVGSGFIVGKGLILTNAHNVGNAKYIELRKQDIAKRYLARVAFVGHDCDLAVLKVADMSFYDGMVSLDLGDIPTVNSTVQTYGFPMGGRQISVTEGVVSRIQMDGYAHTRADSHLVVQTDAAINPGNSGGPVIQNGKVVGVAFQGIAAADNIGYMIPTTVIRHFLTDIKDGKYDGFGSLGFSMFPGLHSESYRDYLKVPKGQQGVVVLSTMMHSSVEKLLQKEDVLTKIGDFDMDNDGMIKIYGRRLHMSEVVEQKQLGEKVELTFYRNGVEKKATATVALNRPLMTYWRQFDVLPRYEVFAGLTFVPVSRNFLETWGSGWSTNIPFYLRYLFANSRDLNTSRKRKEYVVLSEILADEVNSYAQGFQNKVVESVNDIKINSLEELGAAFKSNTGPFCTIKFMSNKVPLILDNKKAVERHDEIMKKYQVPNSN